MACVVDPDGLLAELADLSSRGIDTNRVLVSERAHVIMPYHILLDSLEEQARGSEALGTTGRGIGPAYVDKAGRGGIRVGDLLELEDLMPRLEQTLAFKNALMTKVYGGEPISLDDVLAKCSAWATDLGPYVGPAEQTVQDLLARDNIILLEGAQGTLLDIDHGSYPYVTSSSPTIGGACTGLGLNPQSIAGVVGVYKAYCTRVGEGPMPSEIHGQVADDLREKAQEYGTTTGRPRRLGWFDAVAGKYSRLVQRLHRDGADPAGHPGRQSFGEDMRGLPGRRPGAGPLPGQYQSPGPVPACIRGVPRLGPANRRRHQPIPASPECHCLRQARRGAGRLQGADHFHRAWP